jgi:microprocessor complex subunit DGCR8
MSPPEKGRNHFEMLPEGWVQVTHDSGMPLYLHRQSRVCSLSRPYFLGPGSVRKHEIPISSIPCLNYRKAIDKEKELIEQQRLLKEQQEAAAAAAINAEQTNGELSEEKPSNGLSALLNLNKNDATVAAKPQMPIPTCIAKVETVSENMKAHSLTPPQFTEYCKKLFNFKTIRVMRFKSWSARRKFTKNRKHIKHLQRPSLPDGTKLITFPVLNTEVPTVDPSSGQPQPASTHQPRKKEWVMNPNGKSYVCILHEYVQHALKKQPTYEFKELENSATPYSATVSINNLKYGTGYGTSKKQAKSEAARETLEVLIPEMKEKITGLDKNQSAAGNSSSNKSSAAPPPQDLSVFDEIRIEDPRVPEFCQKTTEPSPHSILLTCLQRNYGLGNIQVKYEVNTAKHKKNEYTMTVGQHVAKVYCKNKRDGKQRASQAILQLLHPHINTWGSLLRLYGNRSVKSFKEKKQEEQEITVLQTRAAVNQPNYAILDKLKSEMEKLKEMKNNVQPIGKLSIPIIQPDSSAAPNVVVIKK